MTDIGIATAGAEQPINRHGAIAGETMSEGDLVGIDPLTGKFVKAGPEGIMAIGACLTPATQLSDYQEDEVKLVIEANRALVDRDKVSSIAYGVEVENGDGDWAFSPGELVYCDANGSYTQTVPGVGRVQIVGVALTEDRIMLSVQPTA